MDLDNATHYPAHLFRTTIDEARLAAAVIVRVTYDVEPGGTCRPAAEQAWPVSVGPWECEYGQMEGDDVFVRGGVDLLIFGFARPPGGVPVSSMQVVVQLGAFQSCVWVYGERRWVERGGRLVQTRPEPFDAIPLTLESAFGGTCAWDGLDVGFPDNPGGKGFYLNADSALGGALPNLEDPAAPVVTWEDRPRPVGVGPCPGAHGGRLENMVFDEAGLLREIRPRFYNAAFPAMIVEEAVPGSVLTVHGVRPEGPFVVKLPDHELNVRLTFDNEVIDRRPIIDQVAVEPDRWRAFITYRHPFRYVLHPMQRRSCRLSGI